MNREALWKTVKSAVLLRCPRCVEGALFQGLFSMRARCAVCDLMFEREPGYFVGAIYINYAVTAVLTIGGFLVLDAYANVSLTVQIALWSVFGIVFPLWFYRYSKSAWLAIDHLISPEEPPFGVTRRHTV